MLDSRKSFPFETWVCTLCQSALTEAEPNFGWHKQKNRLSIGKFIIAKKSRFGKQSRTREANALAWIISRTFTLCSQSAQDTVTSNPSITQM